jgi:exodeoxyribonuclease VII small subunit
MSNSLSFEESLDRLDEIVRALESGETTLDEALGQYEAGVRLLKKCIDQLSRVEQQIILLSGEDCDGRPISQPFPVTAPGDGPKSVSPVRQRRIDAEE